MISEKAEGLIDDFEESCDEYDVHKRNIPKMNLKNYIEQLEKENEELKKKFIPDCSKCKWNEHGSSCGVGNNHPCVTCVTNNFEEKN